MNRRATGDESVSSIEIEFAFDVRKRKVRLMMGLWRPRQQRAEKVYGFMFFWRTYQTIIKLSLLRDVCFLSSAISTFPHMSGTLTPIVSIHKCLVLPHERRLENFIWQSLQNIMLLCNSRQEQMFGRHLRRKIKYLSVKRVYCRGCVRWTDAR